MPDETPKLTTAAVVQHYRDRYDTIASKLTEWEQAKAGFLCDVGRESLMLVRQALEPLGELELTARKAKRAEIVKELEELLPDLEGIGVPQLNRWMRWAGIGEVLSGDRLAFPWGLKQAHLMALEKYIEQHEPTATYRLKGPWKGMAEEIVAVITLTIESGASAAELEQAIDDEADVPETPQETPPCPISTNLTADTQPSPTTASNTAPSPTISKPVAETSKSAPAGSTSSPTPSVKSSNASMNSPAASSPTLAKPQPSASVSSVSPSELADQAFKLMQQPEILAGVMRREWKPDLILALIDNLIKATGEESGNTLGLAKAYHRLKPFVLTYFAEYADDGKFKLRKKDQPEAPTLEQLAGELQTA
jgi:hypothetical protein